MYPYPAGLAIATKGGFDRPGPDRWVENGRPEHLLSACEGSLRRLGVDRAWRESVIRWIAAYGHVVRASLRGEGVPIEAKSRKPAAQAIDHFEPSLVGKIGCTVVGPSNVESKLADVKTVPLSVRISLPPLTIKPVRTEHGPEEHDSYLVLWNGLGQLGVPLRRNP